MADVVAEVQKQALRNKFRLDDYFRDFDQLNHKYINKNRFERALSIAKVQLNRAQLDALEAMFDAGDGNVDYATFCDQVNMVYSVKGLELSPTKQVRLALAGANPRPYGLPLTATESAELRGIMVNVSKAQRDRGVILKIFFRDFDKNNTGFVSESRFHRALQTALPKDINMVESELLAKNYSDGESICYKAFCRDAESTPKEREAIEQQKIAQRNASAKLLNPTTASGANTGILSASWRPNDGELILQRLIRIVSERKIRLRMFFDDFDKMRKGVIKRPKFKTCMYMCLPSEFTEAEMDSLADKYAIPGPDDFVDYRSMCSFIDLAFTAKNLERSPQKGLDSAPWRIAHAPRIRLPQLTDGEEELLRIGLRNLKQIVNQSRMSLQDVFRDFDRTSRGAVTRDQFERVLSLRKIRPEEDEVLECIIKKYGYQSGGGYGTTLVRYRPFLKEVGAVGSVRMDNNKGKKDDGGGVPMSETPYVGDTWRAKGSNADQVMWRIRQFVRGRRLRTKEFFRDSDPLQTGKINIYKFRQGIKEMCQAADLSAAQLQMLEPIYLATGSLDEDTWKSFQPTIDWRQFVADLESVFTVANLERNPTMDVMGATQKVIDAGYTDETSLTEEERYELNEYLRDMKETVTRANILTRMSFQKLDKHKRGLLPQDRFVRCLSLVFDTTRFTDIMPLIAKSEFAVRSLGQSKELYDVNYKKFCDVIDPPERTTKKNYSISAASKVESKSAPVDLDDVMIRIREHVKSRGIPLDVFFKDYDQLRSGAISMGKMHRALDVALGTNFRLTYQEKQALCEKYKSAEHDDEVYWNKFFLDIEQRVHLEQSPTKGLPTWKKWRFSVDATGVDQKALQSILLNIKRVVRERRMNVKQAFQNYDKTNRGTVTKNQFTCVLGFLNLLPSLKEEQDCLLKAFGMIIPGKTDQCHYPTFCQMVDP